MESIDRDELLRYLSALIGESTKSEAECGTEFNKIRQRGFRDAVLNVFEKVQKMPRVGGFGAWKTLEQETPDAGKWVYVWDGIDVDLDRYYPEDAGKEFTVLGEDGDPDTDAISDGWLEYGTPVGSESRVLCWCDRYDDVWPTPPAMEERNG